MNQPIKNWEEKIEYIKTFIELYPTHYNGKPFMLPMGWSRKVGEEVGELVKSLLSEATREAVEKERERIEKLIKSLDVVGYPAISTSEFESMVDEALHPKDPITTPEKCKKHGVVHKNGGYPSCLITNN